VVVVVDGVAASDSFAAEADVQHHHALVGDGYLHVPKRMKRRRRGWGRGGSACCLRSKILAGRSRCLYSCLCAGGCQSRPHCPHQRTERRWEGDEGAESPLWLSLSLPPWQRCCYRVPAAARGAAVDPSPPLARSPPLPPPPPPSPRRLDSGIRVVPRQQTAAAAAATAIAAADLHRRSVHPAAGSHLRSECTRGAQIAWVSGRRATLGENDGLRGGSRRENFAGDQASMPLWHVPKRLRSPGTRSGGVTG
jgi:hypothetical protein